MHHITLNGAGPDDRDLDYKVIESTWPQARQHVHLCPAFHLKYTEAVTFAEHLIRGLIILWDGGECILQPLVQLKQVKCLPDTGQHAEGQNIHLHDTEGINIVLVPFNESALVHGGIADGDCLDQGSARQNKAADML